MPLTLAGPISGNARWKPSASGLGRFGAFQLGRDRVLLRFPFGEQRPDDHGLDEQHDLVPVGVVRAELGALVRIEAALE